MQSTRLFLITAVVLIAGALASFADVVVLKNGEKLQGKIVGETPTEITLDVQVSPGIVDSRVVPKADVASVVKDQPDAAAWQAVRNFKLGPNSLAATAYDAMINPLRT